MEILKEINRTLEIADKLMASRHKHSRVWLRQKARLWTAGEHAELAKPYEDGQNIWADAGLSEDEVCQEEPTSGPSMNEMLAEHSVKPLQNT